MALERQEYPGLLATLQPTQAVSLLNDRVKLIEQVNSSIADWLQERRRIEEQYAESLQKLARRPQQDGAAALGIFQMPWQRIVSSTENLGQSHQTLASKIKADVETPLRQFGSKNREMQSMSTIQGNLSALAKDLDGAQRKAERLKDKGAKAAAGKVASANSGVDDATQQWESQAPYVFEQLQAADESRLNHLRDVLTQFQTHEVDQVERNKNSVESCLNALLTVETADEIKTFAAKNGGGRSSVTRARRQSTSAASSSLPVPPPSRGAGDNVSLTTAMSRDRPSMPPPPPVPESSRSSAFGGLKRLGTVVGRRKSSSNTATVKPTEKTKKSRASFAPFRRENSSRSFQEVSSPQGGLTPVRTQEEESSQPTVEPTRDRRPMNLPAEMDAIEETPFPNGEAPLLANGSPPIRSSSFSNPEEPSLVTANGFAPPEGPPPGRKELQPPLAPSPSPSPFDAISQAQQEAAETNDETDDALRNLTIRDKPIEEDQSEARLAMDQMANQLRMQAQQSGLSRASGSVRGRRDVRNTIFVPNNETPESLLQPGAPSQGPQFASPIKRSGTPGTILEDHPTSDNISTHSSHTAPSIAPPTAHPEMHGPGLSASILETVSTWMTAGSVTKSFVVGEVALSYNEANAGAPKTSQLVRLDKFEALEKVAANPSFIQPFTSAKGKESEEERAGQYQVSLGAISKSSPTVAFKYQLHVDDSTLAAYSPVLFMPAWQIQDTQASVIIHYSLNPVLGTHASTVILKNVVLTVNIEPGTSSAVADGSTAQSSTRATNAMMSPTAGASFKRKQNLVVWRIPELTISLDAEPSKQRFLARFITTGPKGKEGKIEAKWEVQGDLASKVGSGLGVSELKAVEKDPFADDGGSPIENWDEVDGITRKIASGKYCAN